MPQRLDRAAAIAALLAFNGGYVDAAGFLGLQGLFTAHVTGNFVTLGAALVFGGHGIYAKLVALPEFIAVVALARLAGGALRARQRPVLRTLFAAEAVLLLAFFVLAVGFGPFADSDSPAALVTGFAGIAAMAVQNAVQRVHLGDRPPTTIMTGNTTQATLDAVDLVIGAGRADEIRARFRRVLFSIGYFAGGCASAALLYWWIGFWCLALPAVLAAVIVPLQPSASSVAGKTRARRRPHSHKS
jgi:uncharacterized membrane protein YoaK (UPF0700 family)